MNKAFSLEENPFYVLRATYSATRAGISELVEDAIFDRDGDEDVLADAQQQLVSPNQRLNAEVAYLPELSEVQLGKTLQAIENGQVVHEWPECIHYPELARANILAHVSAASSADFDLISALIAAWIELDPSDAQSFIQRNRKAASFPSLDPDVYLSALANLKKVHAIAAAGGVMRSENPGQLMTALVERYAEDGLKAPLLDAMVVEYDKATEGELSRIATALEACADAIEARPGSCSEEVARVPVLLEEWDEINQPVQLYEQARGHEEGRSKKISNRLRAVCLTLANEHNDYASASIISKALLHTFPELESLAEQLKSDVSQLEKLSEEHEVERELSGLFSAFEAAKANLAALASAMKKKSVSSSSPSPLGPLIHEFSMVHARKGVSEVAWKLIRALALSLNNDADNPWASWFLIDSMTSRFGSSLSAEMKAQLADDKIAAFKNWKFGELKASSSAGKQIALIDEMLPYATGDEAAQLSNLRRRLAGRRIWRWIKTSAFLGVAVFGLSSVLLGEMNTKPRSTYSPPTSSKSSSRSLPSSESGSSNTSASNSGSFSSSSSTTETKPAIGTSRVLTRSEIRYCLYQGERMDHLRPMIDNYNGSHVDLFNALINDLNARCGSYRYYYNDRNAVRREVASKTFALKSEAQRIYESW
ncbi:hypothetical protein KUW14_03180 [Pseudooceanicola nitratireducens]|uniref:hypothetical protein n=1 Tax=Pseudooceanicola nitratireducens TaxID=517719 RepID=UPI001C9459B9|nr:hypothetical protein [Pseudooceanicola nitratireducens]MBY6164842.1 hypothetical protein [Pseudooceanicola nitratireducens]